MTILDATNHLYDWFRTNDSFEENRDLRKILPIIEKDEETNVAFKIALVELEKINLIAAKEYGEKTYHVLRKPYEAYTQNVEISSHTSKWVAEHINDFCNLIEDKTDLCNATSINDKDVKNLLLIIQFYRNKTIEKEDIITKMSGLQKNDTPLNGEDDKNSEDKKKKK